MWKQQELGFLAHICAPTAPGLTYAMRMIKCFGEKLAKIPLRENREVTGGGLFFAGKKARIWLI
jgi:hypothetical protein